MHVPWIYLPLFDEFFPSWLRVGPHLERGKLSSVAFDEESSEGGLGWIIGGVFLSLGSISDSDLILFFGSASDTLWMTSTTTNHSNTQLPLIRFEDRVEFSFLLAHLSNFCFILVFLECSYFKMIAK